jgi:DNA-binding MarR family transcriptional regulator
VKALLSLDPDDPPPMRRLAEDFRCDASFITAIVDRLEERGLAERRPHASDRRVKVVAITPEGLEAKRFAESLLFQVPEELASLPQQDQEALLRIAEHLRRVRMPA